MPDLDFYIDVMGDIRCSQCLPGLPEYDEGFGKMPTAAVQELGAVLVAFGKDVVCSCERLRWDATARTATTTARTP